MADLKDKRIVFIFDECHRSQFGDTHKRIKEFFRITSYNVCYTKLLRNKLKKQKYGKKVCCKKCLCKMSESGFVGLKEEQD